ncbi:MAG: phytanoyl-CoA dioxygenase family protein [Alphaproteobacteria bacterium]|nr:MAG: phytanoyl-CoA dioxygenase family protein [Alphaproteobacteria bacterium]
MCRSAGLCGCAQRWPSCSTAAAARARATASTCSRKAIRRAIRGCIACPARRTSIRPSGISFAADVVGPDVKFHHAKLNVKSGQGSRGFSWHQDIPAWPHTDFSPVTVGIYIDGCTPEQGPLTVAEGSHEGPLFSMYDDAGNYVVKIRDSDLGWLNEDSTRRLTGGPGTTLLLNCRAVHGSAPNKASAARPLLLPVYSSADSFPITPSPIPSPHQGDIVRGRPARFASFDTRPVEMPPDWRGGYKPVWMHKNKDETPY